MQSDFRLFILDNGYFSGQEMTSRYIDDINNLLKQIAESRGCLKPGGEPDIEQASQILLKDYSDGKLGRLILDETEPEPLPDGLNIIWEK